MGVFAGASGAVDCFRPGGVSVIRAIPYLVFLVAIAGALYQAYRHGAETTAAAYEARLAEQARDGAQAMAKAVSNARAAEQAAAAYVAAIDKQHAEALQHEINTRDRTISGLRDGTIQLRKRFACQGAADGMPAAASDTGSSDAASTGGLRAEDAGFLIRLASDADALALQLQACQAIVRQAFHVEQGDE